MVTPPSQHQTGVPAEAVEAAVATSSRQHLRRPEEAARYRERVRAVIEAALPALRAGWEREMRERLLSDEAIEAYRHAEAETMGGCCEPEDVRRFMTAALDAALTQHQQHTEGNEKGRDDG